MGGKKKGGGGKKKDEEADESTAKLYKLYKKKVAELGCETSKRLIEQFNDEESGDIEKVR